MIYIVAGMHRSGTSAIAGLLHQNGISMGEADSFWPAASPENPKGFFEDVRFRMLSDRMLRSRGHEVADWDVPDRFYNIPGMVPACVDLIRSVDSVHENWGWKDPRTCLTWPTWVTALEQLELEYKIIGTVRPHTAIADSMRRRGNDVERHRAEWISEVYARSLKDMKPDVLIGFDFSPKDIQDALGEIGLEILNLSFLDATLRNRG
jgi:hypothetical protein